MASSEEDGTNGASEASDEKEAAGKRRRLGLLATAWLTFYNIAMTAGYVRAKVLPRSASTSAVPQRSGLGDAGSALSRGCWGSRARARGWNGSARGNCQGSRRRRATVAGAFGARARVSANWGSRPRRRTWSGTARVPGHLRSEHSGRVAGAQRARARVLGPRWSRRGGGARRSGGGA